MTLELQTPQPTTRERTQRMSGIFEVQHPLIAHHLSQLRDKNTDPAEFRRLVQRLAVLLAYEATKDLEVDSTRVQTPLATTALADFS